MAVMLLFIKSIFIKVYKNNYKIIYIGNIIY